MCCHTLNDILSKIIMAALINRICYICYIFNVSLCMLFINVVKCDTSLYNADDGVTVLNSTNFDNIILGTENNWFVQFYATWCGHCIGFKPNWTKFAQRISG